DAFQIAQFGGAVLNPAFFNPKANHIAAFNVVQSTQAEEVRKLVVAKEQEIAEFRDKVNREEVRIDKQVREIKAKLNDLVAQAKKESRGDPKAEAEINRQKKNILEQLKSDEDEAKKQLEDYRRKMNEAIERNWEIVRENRATLQKQGRRMYETLFHEAFHAFATNFVGAGGQDFVVTHPNDVARSNAHYAGAWALAHYLVGKGTTRDQFEAYAK